jgi:hypothetical protein
MAAALPYQHPVDQILRIKEPTHWGDSWLDYVGQFGLTIADIPELMRLCWDPNPPLVVDGDDDAELMDDWPIHGLRAVTLLDPIAGIDLFLELISAYPEDDFIREEAEGLGNYVGAEAIEPLTMFLADVRENPWSRNATITILENLGQARPELRGRIVQLMMEWLQQSKRLGGEETREILVAGLISALIELKATEAADVLAEIFATGEVDEWVTGSWPAIQVEMGLKQESDFSPEELEPTPPSYITAIWESQAEKQKIEQIAAQMLEWGSSSGSRRSMSLRNQPSSGLPPAQQPPSRGFGVVPSGKKGKKNKKKR